MAVQTLNFFDLTHITTDDPDGFSDNGGYQFNVNVSHVTIQPGAVSTPLSVNDTVDTFFDDDAGAAQTLDGAQTINGTLYPDGTFIEAEYRIVVRDSLNNDYELQFVALNNDAYNIEGFVVQGAMPPTGEELLIVGSSDFPSGTYAYDTSSPACFGPGTRIATTRGQIRARALKAGDQVLLAEGGYARVALVLSSRAILTARVTPLGAAGPTGTDNKDSWPIRIRAGALGHDLPKRDLILSPQHRVWVPALGGLVAAKALICLPRVGFCRSARRKALIHVVLAEHAVLLAEGVPSESFWPGDNAMRLLPQPARRAVRRVMGDTPVAAADFISVQDAIKRLARPSDTEIVISTTRSDTGPTSGQIIRQIARSGTRQLARSGAAPITKPTNALVSNRVHPALNAAPCAAGEQGKVCHRNAVDCIASLTT